MTEIENTKYNEERENRKIEHFPEIDDRKQIELVSNSNLVTQTFKMDAKNMTKKMFNPKNLSTLIFQNFY